MTAHQAPGIVPGTDFLLPVIAEHLLAQDVPHPPDFKVFRLAGIPVGVHGVVQHPGGGAGEAGIHHVHEQLGHIQRVEIVIHQHVAVAALRVGVSLHALPVHLCEGGVGLIGKILEAHLTQNDRHVPHGFLVGAQGLEELSAAHVALSGIGMHIVNADLRDLAHRRVQPAERIVGRCPVGIVDHGVRTGNGDVRQRRVFVHLGPEEMDHLFPEGKVSVRGSPVSVRLVEDDEMADAGESVLGHQPVEVPHGCLHPFGRSLHVPGGRIVLSIHHHDAAALAVLQQLTDVGRVALVVKPRPVKIGERAVDHAAHILRAHEVQAPEKRIPVCLGDFSAPGKSFVVRVPFHSVPEIGRIGIDDLSGEAQRYRTGTACRGEQQA